jgi:hypothetical protein
MAPVATAVQERTIAPHLEIVQVKHEPARQINETYILTVNDPDSTAPQERLMVLVLDHFDEEEILFNVLTNNCRIDVLMSAIRRFMKGTDRARHRLCFEESWVAATPF